MSSPGEVRTMIAGGLAMLCSVCSLSTLAAAYRPAQDTDIIDTLPSGSLTYQQLSGLNSAKAKLPFEQVAAQIDALIKQAYRSGDPHSLGLAEAMMQPYQQDTTPAIRLTRANIYQATHRFTQARQELQAILKQMPNQPDSLLMLASIDIVQGDFKSAANYCQRISDPGLLVIRLACQAQIDGMTGKLKASAATMQQLLQLNSGLTAEQQQWLYLILADMALRLDDPVLARQVFSLLDRDTAPALTARADWLMAHQAWQLTRNLLIAHTDNDSLLLRLSIAEQQLGHPDATSHRSLLAQRLAIWQQRGETAHQREQAYHALWFGTADQTLQLARLNWQKQRESADFSLYAQAAMRANSLDDLKILQQWVKSTGFEYPRLNQKIAQHINQIMTKAGA